MSGSRTILRDVSTAYGHFEQRRDQALSRGHRDKADEAISVLKTMEECVQIKEVSTAWRREIEEIQRRESENRR